MPDTSIDLVLCNARVLTMGSRQPGAELVAVSSGRIVHVGANSDLQHLGKPRKEIDCQGRTVMPGFHDAHAHIMAYVSRLLSVDCSPAPAKSIRDIQEKIREQARRLSPGKWIRASGYNEFYLEEHRHPTRYDLDQAAPDHPVRLSHRSLHAAVLNSAALSLAGIDAGSPDLPGGLIDRDPESGEPTGILFGMNSYLSERVVPPLGKDDIREGIRLANQDFLSSGITSIQDATASNGVKQWEMFRDLKKEGLFVPRLSMMIGSHALSHLQRAGLKPRSGRNDLTTGAVKIVLDESRGLLNPPQDELNARVAEANDAGFQVAIHAVEEGTLEAAIKALERAPGTARNRIEHCSVCPPHLLLRLRAAGAIVVTQPAFIYYSGERYLREVPQEQLRWLYRLRSLLENGIAVAGSSDSPVVPCDPLKGIYASVTRKAENGEPVLTGEAIGIEEALGLYTIGAAYSSFEENLKGSIEAGKLADLIILDADPTEVETEALKDIRIEMTVVGGEVMWEAGNG